VEALVAKGSTGSVPKTNSASARETAPGSAPEKKAFDEEDRRGIELAAQVLRLDARWITDFYAAYRKPRQTVKTVVIHENPDTEALFIAWIVTRTEVGRKTFNVSSDARLVFIPSGPLDPKGALWNIKGFAQENLNAEWLEDHGYLFVDCGGGLGRLDQHGRPENKKSSVVSSLDMLVASNPHLFLDLLYLLPLFEVISRNDKTGEKIAIDSSVERRKSGTPHTDRHLRNILDGLNQMAQDSQSLSWNQVAELIFLAFDSAETFLANKATECLDADGKPDWLKLRECRYEILLLKTIEANLPQAEAWVDLEAAGRYHAEHCLIPEAENRYGALSAGRRDEIVKKAVSDKKIAEQRHRRVVASWGESSQAALKLLEAAWTQAAADYNKTRRLTLIEDAAFLRRDDDREVTDPLVPWRGAIYIVSLISSSTRAGAYTRYVVNGYERKRVKDLLIAAARAKFGSNKEPGSRSPEQATGNKDPGAGIPEQEAGIPESRIGNTDSGTENREQEVRSNRPSEPPPDVRPEPEDGAEFDDNGLETDGDYAGLPVEIAERIKAAVVATRRANSVVLQIHTPSYGSDGKTMMNCKFGVATTQIYLCEVVREIRAGLARAWGLKPEVDDLATAPYLLTRDRRGNRLRLDYRPEFGTYYGDWFKTNQTLPDSRLLPVELWDLLVRGLAKADTNVREQAKRQGTPLAEPAWMELYRELTSESG
jgi:hypothetical protein